MRGKIQHFNKIKSTSAEIAHLANIMNNDKITKNQLIEWKIRKNLLIEKLKIILDKTEECLEALVEEN